jgi:hypothetical protein
MGANFRQVPVSITVYGRVSAGAASDPPGNVTIENVSKKGMAGRFVRTETEAEVRTVLRQTVFVLTCS